jgi:NhaP-type Na+/H+ or K+/H+ antiporter
LEPSLGLSVWRLIVIAILVLLLRRLPIIIMLYRWIPDIKTFREAVFSGHFGPIGIGAVFISTLAVEVLHNAHEDGNPQVVLLQETIQPIVAFMVLCSITIHGLSIPSFSLGRRVHSVSRTWSRRDTQTSAAPDWTTQTRMVTRGEDIVINRDIDDLERGSIGLEKTGSGKSTPTDEMGRLDSSGISDETKVHGAESQRPRSTTARQQPQNAVGDYRDEVPPDGTEKISEWIEGGHRIIEKKLGPGSDVRGYIGLGFKFCATQFFSFVP